MPRSVRSAGPSLLIAAMIALGLPAQAQQADPSPTKTDDQLYTLSPFKVSTDKDKGYLATNSTSGTRLNSAIKDLPMPIQVLTSQFISDIGATDLRQALRYSSAIQLTDWNTTGMSGGSFSNTPGKVNNPEGATASASQTTVKFRGFETTSVLRDGFARGNSTDEVNIERVELVSGPSSLLYGVSNFGGVVNYFVKQPLDKPAQGFDVTYGSYNFKRATFDTTGPITKSIGYRLTGSWQSQDSWTDFNTEKHWFVSPVLVFKPFESTKVTVDLEYGHQRKDGIGWQDLRASPSYINSDSNSAYGFLDIGGRSPRLFRWSGPDTYNSNYAGNVELKLEQHLAEGLDLWVGANRSTFNYTQLDNMAALQPAANFSGATGALALPASDIATIVYKGLSSNQANISTGSMPSTITYQWERKKDATAINQARVDLTYHLKLFENSGSKWLHMDNSFLAGFSYQRNREDYHTWQTPGDAQNYHSPTDFSYIRFGTQSSGRADIGMTQYDNYISTTPDTAGYFVYQAKLLNDKLTVVAGIRHDRSHNTYWQYSPEYQFSGSLNGSSTASETRAPDSSNRTIQWGVSYAVTPEISVFGMNSGGVQPNYTGQLNDYGVPIGATLARDSEAGIKFDLGHGRVSGSVSWFCINRTNAPVGSTNGYWWAPTNIKGRSTWDPTKDIVYQLDSGLNPTANWYPESSAAATQWNAAVAAGAIYQATNSNGSTNWYVNATKATGAAYLDKVYATAVANKQQDWFGWLYNTDNLTNNASQDQAGTATNGKDVLLGSDRSSGFEGNLLFRPTDELQIALGWSYTKKIVVSGGQWIKYPYSADRWAVWYDPVTWAGLQGKSIDKVYANPSDTSTWIAYTSGMRDDDTPRNQGSIWIDYTAPKASALKGWSIGGGAAYVGPRQYLSGTTPLGTTVTDSNGNPIDLNTRSQVTTNGMLKYEFSLSGHPASVQFNVDNLFNNRKQTVAGAWQDPRIWRLSFGMHL